MTTKPLVTAVLMSYKRQPNMPAIIESYRAQSVPVEVWLINNNGLEDFGADKLIAIPWNAGEMARYIFCARPDTDYVCFQDDDFQITGADYVECGIEAVERRPDYLVGASGRNVNWEADFPTAGHYAPEAHVGQGAAILKGHFQIFRKSYASRVHIPGHWAASDIYWSLDGSRGAPAHYVDPVLSKRLKRLDTHGTGLEFRPEHWKERSGVVKDYLSDYLPYWWNAGNREGAYKLYPEDYNARKTNPETVSYAVPPNSECPCNR